MAEDNNDQKSALAEAGGQYPGPVRPALSWSSEADRPSIPSVDDQDSPVSDYCKVRSEAKMQILTDTFQADADSAIDGLSDMFVLG
jgi:hypothetical protein